MNGSKAPAGNHYFCRGCGDPLPSGWHGQFHRECLKADKRRRTQEKRRQERARLQQWLQRQHCPQCGASLRVAPAPPARLSGGGEDPAPGEASWAMAPRDDSSH